MGWLQVPLVYQVTGTVATTINMTGIIFIKRMYDEVYQLLVKFLTTAHNTVSERQLSVNKFSCNQDIVEFIRIDSNNTTSRHSNVDVSFL